MSPVERRLRAAWLVAEVTTTRHLNEIDYDDIRRYELTNMVMRLPQTGLARLVAEMLFCQVVE